jgi:hypothetical protein
MITFQKVHPIRHGIVYLRDAEKFELPLCEPFDGLWLKPGCIVASCNEQSEGDVALTVGFGLQPGEAKLLYDGVLETPSCTVVLETVYDELAKIDVPTPRTRVRIWHDGWKPSEFLRFDLSVEPT